MVLYIEFADGRIMSYDTQEVMRLANVQKDVEVALRTDLLFAGKGLRVDYLHNELNDPGATQKYTEPVAMCQLVEEDESDQIELVEVYEAGSCRPVALRMDGQLIDCRAIDRAAMLLAEGGYTSRIDSSVQTYARTILGDVETACAATGVSYEQFRWAHRARSEAAKYEAEFRNEVSEATSDAPSRVDALTQEGADVGADEGPQEGAGDDAHEEPQETPEGPVIVTSYADDTDPFDGEETDFDATLDGDTGQVTVELTEEDFAMDEEDLLNLDDEEPQDVEDPYAADGYGDDPDALFDDEEEDDEGAGSDDYDDIDLSAGALFSDDEDE